MLRRGSFVADVSFSKPTVAAAKVIGSTVLFPSTRRSLCKHATVAAVQVEDGRHMRGRLIASG